MNRPRRAALSVVIALVGSALWWPAAASAVVPAVVNVPPVAVDDPGSACFPPDFGGAFPVPEDSAEFSFVGVCSAIANDTDSDGTIVAWHVVTQPSHGTLEYLEAYPNAFGYTPDADWSTPAGDWVSDSFTYQAIDNDGGVSNVATMRFWVAPFNDPPVFLDVPDVEVNQDSGAYDASWLSHVSPGPPNESTQAVHFHITTVASHGVVNLFSVPPDFTSDGHLTFTPGPGEHGYADVTVYLQDDGGLEHYSGVPDRADDTSDPVTFTITVDPDLAPVAVDDTATVAEDAAPTSIPVRTNDTDADGDTLSITGKTDGSKSVVAISVDGTSLTYQPNPNANGADTFTYTIDDGKGGTDTATVHVTITPVNDPPNAVNDGAPTAIKIGTGAGPVTINVLGNDTSAPDGLESLHITAVTSGSHGTVAIGPRGSSLTYDPAGVTTGADTFTYTISDGHGGLDTATVQVLVAADATAPVVSVPQVAVRPTRYGTAQLTVSWTASDPESGIRSNTLQMSRDGGSYATIALTDPTTSRATLFVAKGHTYRFRVTVTGGNGLVRVSTASRIVSL